MTASLNELSSGLWNITLSDNTTGQQFQVQAPYDSSNSSAEWIQEDPSSGYGQVPLDNFGSLQFTNASAIAGGSDLDLSAIGAQALTMDNQVGQALATVSGLSAPGNAFTVTRTAASSQVSTPNQPASGRLFRHGEGIGHWRNYQTGPDGSASGYPARGFRSWWQDAGF
jgi:hypothetical protein